MIYLVFGNEEIFVKTKVEELIKGRQNEVIRLDSFNEETLIDDILDSCLKTSLFINSSIVLVDNPFFLISKCDEKLLKGLYDYVNNPSYDIDLILYSSSNSFNTKLNAYKKISQNAQVFRCDGYLKQYDFDNYFNEQINKYDLNIDKDACDLLNIYSKKSATLLHMNLDILKLYPDKITKEVVNKLTTKADYDNFDLINAIINKNISLSLTITKNFFKEQGSIYLIIYSLSSQLRFLYYVAYLKNKNYRIEEIENLTNAKPYRIKMALKSLENLDMIEIMNLLNKLYELELLSKSDSSISEYTRFELFIINLIRKNNYASNQASI